MGTNFAKGEKPKNNVTISKGGDVPARSVNPETGAQDRSFAQPNPAVEHPELKPDTKASAQEQVEALNQNSQKGRSYNQDGDDASGQE